MSPPHWLSTSPSACPDSTVKHRHVQDQSLRLAPAAAARRAHDAAPRRRHRARRDAVPVRCFRHQFLHVAAMPRALTALLLHTPPAVVACEFFAHPRAAVDRMLPARLFPLPPPRLHCRAARRCAACAGRTGPPLAAACSRALRLLGSSARPRLRLRVWASAEPFLRGSGFAVTDCRRPPFGAANSLPPLAPARNAHTTREGGLGGEREASHRRAPRRQNKNCMRAKPCGSRL